MLKELSSKNIEEILQITHQLNPEKEITTLKKRVEKMFTYANYTCFGFYKKEVLIGVAGTWQTERLYSGKQIELDHVALKKEYQSKGYGQIFLELIESWAKKNNCKTVELNTYTQNTKSHKFYYTSGFEILGFHFLKKIT